MKFVLGPLFVARPITLVVAFASIGTVFAQTQPGEEEGLYPVPRDQQSTEGSLNPQSRDSAISAPSASARRVVPSVASRPAVNEGGSSTGELFFQIQTLQEEVMQLRGMVEEHEQTIRQLKQQRLDDYKNLDRRIAEMGAGGAADEAPVSAGAQLNSKTDGTGTQTQPTTAPSVDEEQQYRNAYELVRGRRFTEATQAFESFLERYPASSFTPNALYWLGELYVLDGRNDAAAQRFAVLVSRYPQSQKAPDAMFKLAKVYHIQGRSEEARRLLERVKTEHAGTSAARLASEYLQQNF